MSNSTGHLSQTVLRDMVDGFPAEICILNPQGIIVQTNAYWVANPRRPGLGVDYVQTCAEQNFVSITGVPLHDAIESILKDTEDFVYAYACETTSGPYSYQTQVSPITSGSNSETGAMIVHLDITSETETRTALASKSDELELVSLVARYTENSVYITNARFEIEWINDAFVKQTGYSREQAVGRSPLELLTHAEQDSNLIDAMLRRIMGRRGYDNEFLNVDAEGNAYWVHREVRPIRDTNGRIKRFVVLESNINERVLIQEELNAKQELLEAVVENVPHPVFWKNRTGRYLGCNSRFARHLGLQTPEAIIDRTDAELPMSSEQIKIATAEDSNVLRSGEAQVSVRSFSSENNPPLQYMVSKVPLRARDGEVCGVLGIMAEISEVKRLEGQLAEARRLEAIGQLSAGIAHEINTPLQYVGDNLHFMARACQLLLDLGDVAAGATVQDTTLAAAVKAARLPVLKKRVPKALEAAKEGVQNVSSIVQAMKGFAHPGTRSKSRSDINAGLETTVSVSRNEWKYCATVELDLQPDLPFVTCDITEVNQVFLNLIVNAAHALGDREGAELGKITIRTRAIDDMVQIQIADNGAGIPQDIQDRVFEPFFTTKEVGKGTGQGLPLARATINERHGGDLRFESRVNVGTTFFIDLPIEGLKETQ